MIYFQVIRDREINQQYQINQVKQEVALLKNIVEDGQRAVEILTEQPHQFDIIFMDMQMPVMDSITAKHFIRDTLKLTDLPIIAMTANAMMSDQ